MTVICLESEAEEFASNQLSAFILKMIDQPHEGGIKYIRDLWDGESWESIQEKVQTEGSVWYVWWMDGVRAYLEDLNEPD